MNQLEECIRYILTCPTIPKLTRVQVVLQCLDARRLRLFMCDCAYRLIDTHRQGSEGLKKYLQVSQRYAEGLASLGELREADREARNDPSPSLCVRYALAESWTIGQAEPSAEMVRISPSDVQWQIEKLLSRYIY